MNLNKFEWAVLKENGWTMEKSTRGGHIKFTRTFRMVCEGDGRDINQTVTRAMTPSDSRAWKGFVASVRKMNDPVRTANYAPVASANANANANALAAASAAPAPKGVGKIRSEQEALYRTIKNKNRTKRLATNAAADSRSGR